MVIDDGEYYMSCHRPRCRVDEYWCHECVTDHVESGEYNPHD